MSGRAVLFSGPMVRAIYDGRKTQTRRVVRFRRGMEQPPEGDDHPSRRPGDVWRLDDCDWIGGDYAWWSGPADGSRCGGCTCKPAATAYAVEGQRLWVRETWAEYPSDGDWVYRADFDANEPRLNLHDVLKWRPSIYMPRAASRLTLEVTGVRVERLHAITAEDVWAEGASHFEAFREAYAVNGSEPIAAFGVGWDSINGKRPGCAWADDPWVWVLSFKRLEAA